MSQNTNPDGAFRKPAHPSDPQDPAASEPGALYVFKLYISGATERSQRAVRNIKQLCEQHIPGRYELEVVDLFQEPNLASTDEIAAVPTLIKRLPLPLRRIIGDLSDTEEILVRLKLPHGPH